MTVLVVDNQDVAADLDPPGSQPGHRIPDIGGDRRTREDTMDWRFEFGRTLEESRGYLRTHVTGGSGP